MSSPRGCGPRCGGGRRRINNVSVQMVCSECAAPLTRINVPFVVYIVGTRAARRDI